MLRKRSGNRLKCCENAAERSEMKKRLITATTAAALLTTALSFPVMAADVTNDETWIYVTDNGTELMRARTCGEKVYTTTALNLRADPAGEIITTIPEGVELLMVGRHEKWCIIQINGVNYFMHADYLTDKKPLNVTEWDTSGLNQTEAEEIPAEEAETPTGGAQNATGVYLGDWTITFYCNCSECCGIWAGGATASGTTPTEGRTVACGSLDFGTQVYIDGLGDYVVEDRGVEGNWIDVYLESHEACDKMGMMSRAVYLTE